jgi:hypothetical protein
VTWHLILANPPIDGEISRDSSDILGYSDEVERFLTEVDSAKGPAAPDPTRERMRGTAIDLSVLSVARLENQPDASCTADWRRPEGYWQCARDAGHRGRHRMVQPR